jgi:uncharacterized membrane protein YozB (DUF420 family)
MYSAVLIAHSWLRWIAILLGVVATITAFTDRGPSNAADRWGLFFMMVLDIQMLLGLLLYLVLSPFTAQALNNFGAAMRNPALRFWAVEHVSVMLVAVVLAHLGRVLARTARTPQSKRRRQIVCYTLATIAMIAATPWPGTANGRPLIRL